MKPYETGLNTILLQWCVFPISPDAEHHSKSLQCTYKHAYKTSLITFYCRNQPFLIHSLRRPERSPLNRVIVRIRNLHFGNFTELIRRTQTIMAVHGVRLFCFLHSKMFHAHVSVQRLSFVDQVEQSTSEGLNAATILNHFLPCKFCTLCAFHIIKTSFYLLLTPLSHLHKYSDCTGVLFPSNSEKHSAFSQQ